VQAAAGEGSGVTYLVISNERREEKSVVISAICLTWLPGTYLTMVVGLSTLNLLKRKENLFCLLVLPDPK